MLESIFNQSRSKITLNSLKNGEAKNDRNTKTLSAATGSSVIKKN